MRSLCCLLVVTCFTWSGCVSDPPAVRAQFDTGQDATGPTLAEVGREATADFGPTQDTMALQGQDAGDALAFPAVCTWDGQQCTTGQEIACIPRQDPNPAVWDWGPQEAELRIVNCDVQPITFYKVEKTTTTPAGYPVTLLPPSGGPSCDQVGLVVQPTQACFVRARFDRYECQQGGCSFQVPAARIDVVTSRQTVPAMFSPPS